MMTLSEMRDAWKRDRWVKPFFKQYRKALVLALFLGLVSFGFASGLMFTSGYLISSAAAVPESILMLNLPIILVRIFGVGKPVVHYLERLCSHEWVLRMTSALRVKLYRAIEDDALFFRITHRTGDVLGLLAEDIGHVQDLYVRTVFPTVVAYLAYFALIAGLGFASPFLALALALMLGVVVFLMPLVSVLVNGERRFRCKAMRNELYAELTDNVLGVSDWVFSQRGSEYVLRCKRCERAVKELEREQGRFDRVRDMVVQVLLGACVVVIVLWAGASFGAQQSFGACWIAAFSLGFFPLMEAFSPLSSAASDVLGYSDSVVRLGELEDPCDKDGTKAAPRPQLPLDICIEKAAYTYPGCSKRVIDGVDLVIPRGQKIAVLGRSGAGKSTLAALVRGDIAPDAGCVRLGGVACSAFGDDMASYIGVIQQTTYLFNMTLWDNLRIAREDVTRAEAWDALDKVGLREMVERLPSGLDTMVDEAGLRFSGGERHRIALARVLLQDVPIVVLDEPTVGLDPATERTLLETVLSSLEGKTLIMITHHLAGVSAMDRVVFLENGRIALDGVPCQLARDNERYHRLLAFDRGATG